MKRRVMRAWYVAAFYLSWLMFGIVGLLLNVACLPLLLFRQQRKKWGRPIRAIIRGLFDFFMRWCHASGVLSITWRGFDHSLAKGTVYVANHPTFIDATFILSRLPNAICIFKPRLMRNPAIGPAAIMAGYPPGETGVNELRAVSAQVAAGLSLLIFPEGTRTKPGEALGPFNAGFALIASRAGAPVQTIIIRTTPGILPRGRAWWRPPECLPGLVEVSLGRCWTHLPGRHAADLSREIETYLRPLTHPLRGDATDEKPPRP